MEIEETNTKKRRFSIGAKMYIFVICVVLGVAFGTSAISYLINADQIDSYFKRLAKNTAENFASFVNVEYLSELRTAAESEEYQAVRDQAEADDDESGVQAYLEEHGLWGAYNEQRDLMRRYLSTMDDVKYLYLIVWGDVNEKYDMYLIDADDVPIYQTGYYEEREAEFDGVSPDDRIAPVISHGPWGWLCSAYTPIYDRNREIICHIGCDVDMEGIMAERWRFLIYVLITALVFTALVLAISILFANKVIVKPLRNLTTAAKHFSPYENADYKKAGVVDLDLKGTDEIKELYDSIRSMEMDIVDYLNDIKSKEQQIGEISKEAYRDVLTGLGNKTSYVKKCEELNRGIQDGDTEFAIVVADLNNLKLINDKYGHRAGDKYIIGCSRIICNVFKHSPVYRIGGDEFVAVLRGEDFENRHELVDKARAAYAKSFGTETAEPHHRYSAAIGMAECAADDSTAEFVFKRADKTMYADKTEFKQTFGSYR